MKKIITLTLALGLSSTAFAVDMSGDGTSHVRLDGKSSNLTRAAVVSKADSTSTSNFVDGTVVTEKGTPSKASRSEVVRKMDGFQYADFGDGTNPTPWKRVESPNKNLALDKSGSKPAMKN